MTARHTTSLQLCDNCRADRVVAPGAAGGTGTMGRMPTRLLVLEDDDGIRTALRLSMEDEGYDVSEHADAEGRSTPSATSGRTSCWST